MIDRTIVILIDALGFALCRNRGFAPAGLDHRARIRTVLGFSQAALATIFTGLAPAEHGLWMMYSFREEGGPLRWVRILPRSVSARRRWLRRLMAWNLRRVHGVRSYFSLYDVPREVLPYVDIPARGDIFAPGGAAPARTIFDCLAEEEIPYRVWDYRSDEERSFAELEEAAAGGRERFLLLYAAGLDSDLHRFGSGDGRVAARLEGYRLLIERVAGAARRSGGARIFVLGDHGMCDVRSRIDVMSRASGLGLSIPGEYIPFYDSTMARFRTLSAPARRRLEDLLADVPGGRVLGDDEMRSLGAGGAGGRFGDVVYLADPGVVISPSHMGEGRVAAMHGYHPDTEEMHSVMLANEPLPGRELELAAVAGTIYPGFVPGVEGAP
jgi:hypothetical protein